MTQPPEEFPELRRVLAWKRHETPPPGYFTNFSTKVIARIEAGHNSTTAPWWRGWLAPLNWQRGLLGANVLIVAGVALVGVAAFHAVGPAAEDENLSWAALPAPPLDPSGRAVEPFSEQAASGFSTEDSGTSPVMLAGFTGIGRAGGSTNEHAAPVGLFNPPGLQQLQPRFVLPQH
jgi:hypothetical protein